MLSEVWGLDPEFVRSLPYSRRKRLIYKKEQLELKRKNKSNSGGRVRRY